MGRDNCLDPMDRDYRGKELESISEIVERDKADIENCTHVLAYYEKPSVGTSMEILFAWERKIPVYLVTKKGINLSPWLVYHSTKIYYSLDDAIQGLN